MSSPILRSATIEDIPAIARVHVDSWRTTYSGIIPDRYLADLTYERRAQGWYQILNPAPDNSYFAFVVEDESGAIVGFAAGGAERTNDPIYRGELTAIYILNSHQRQGLGYRLWQAVAAKLRQTQIESMLVWVLADNPASNFYAALGGQKIRTQKLEIGGKSLIEVAYGWTNTATSIERTFNIYRSPPNF